MKKGMRRLLMALLLALIAAGGWLAHEHYLAPQPLPQGLVQANGRIEGDEIFVAAKFGGRVAALPAREGDNIEKGQTMARLEDEQTRRMVQAARSKVQSLEAETGALKEELALLRRRVPLEVARTEKALDAAKAELQKAIARKEQAAREAQRYAELLEKDTVARQAAERFSTEYKTATKAMQAADATLEQRKRALEQAKLGTQRIRSLEKELQAARAGISEARAELQRLQATLEDMTIRAPASGVVLERVADLGEVVPAGAVLYSLVDLDALYLKAYVPERDVVQLAQGQPARVYPDAYPGDFAPAELRFIASQAEFTPKEVQTARQRSDLVYAVKLYLEDNPEQMLTPGLPADAVIRTAPETSWAEPRS